MIQKEKAEELYNKSIEILKDIQLKNGGCLATPKGKRYPYIYARDHAIITCGFNSAGMLDEAKRSLDFIFRCQLKNGAFPQRIDTDGKDASYKPIQIDGVALILYSLYDHYKKSKDKKYIASKWNNIKKAVGYILQNYHKDKQLIYTLNSIHEFPPIEKGYEIWANCICYSALDKMYKLSIELNHTNSNWKETADKLKKGIIKQMWNSQKKCFIKNIHINDSSSVVKDTDACEYAVGEFGVLKDNHQMVKSTVEQIDKELWNKDLGGVCRYKKCIGRNNGGWGPWSHFTLILARHHIRTKNKIKADQYINWILKIAENNLLPEHISTVDEFEEYVTEFKEAGILRPDRLILINNARKDPSFKKGVAYITMPLAWPHAEFIRTWNLYKKTFNHQPLKKR